MARPLGSQNKDKPFREALRLELAAAGEDNKVLRAIARNLIADAQKPENALQAIREIADRLDGKPASESTVTVSRVTAKELPDDELAAIAVGSGEGIDTPQIDPKVLN